MPKALGTENRRICRSCTHRRRIRSRWRSNTAQSALFVCSVSLVAVCRFRGSAHKQPKGCWPLWAVIQEHSHSQPTIGYPLMFSFHEFPESHSRQIHHARLSDRQASRILMCLYNCVYMYVHRYASEPLPRCEAKPDVMVRPANCWKRGVFVHAPL